MIIERHLGTDQGTEVQHSMISYSQVEIGLILRCELEHHCPSRVTARVVVDN